MARRPAQVGDDLSGLTGYATLPNIYDGGQIIYDRYGVRQSSFYMDEFVYAIRCSGPSGQAGDERSGIYATDWYLDGGNPNYWYVDPNKIQNYDWSIGGGGDTVTFQAGDDMGVVLEIDSNIGGAFEFDFPEPPPEPQPNNLKAYYRRAGTDTLIPVTPYFRRAGSATLHRLGGIDFRSPPPPIPYLTFQSESPFTLRVYNGAKHWDGTLYYSTDTTTWNEWNGTTTLSSVGNKLYLRGTGNTVITGSTSASRRWVLTGTAIECVGNIENLLDWETVALGEHPTMETYCYYYMFRGCTSLTTAPELPATIMTDNCYREMFYNCTSLTTAPALPATVLASSCYNSMFFGCTSLTTAPKLPATTLASNCYNYMFYGCISLTTAPKLPATVLAFSCYSNMFRSCSAFKVSATQKDSYQYAWRIPTSGNGTTAASWNIDMLYGTGGTFTSSPGINATYYLENPPV